MQNRDFTVKVRRVERRSPSLRSPFTDERSEYVAEECREECRGEGVSLSDARLQGDGCGRFSVIENDCIVVVHSPDKCGGPWCHWFNDFVFAKLSRALRCALSKALATTI